MRYGCTFTQAWYNIVNCWIYVITRVIRHLSVSLSSHCAELVDQYSVSLENNIINSVYMYIGIVQHLFQIFNIDCRYVNVM